MPIEELKDMNGVVRRMGWKPPDANNLKMRAARTSIQDLRVSRGLPPLVDPKDYREVDFYSGPLFGTRVINDQRSCSGCTGWSAAQGLMRQRIIRGMPFVKLSGAFIYANINGGRDQGSVIVDAMESLQTDGTCPESEFDYPKIYGKQIPSGARTDAAKYRLVGSITIDSFAECCTALLMGMIPQFPISVGGNFERFTSTGVAGVNKATQGNHSVHGAGLKNVNGTWCIVMPNSWGATWGPWGNGCCFLTQAHIDNCDHPDDGYAHADASWDAAANVGDPN